MRSVAPECKSMTKLFDLVVIGTGTAASTIATACREAGWRVAIIDSLPFGGTRALRGCDPKKVLVGVAEIVDWARRTKGKGVREDGLSLDWADLMHFKRSFTDPVPQNREQDFAQEGILAVHGRARFVGPMSVQVNQDLLEGRHVVIATSGEAAQAEYCGGGVCHDQR